MENLLLLSDSNISNFVSGCFYCNAIIYSPFCFICEKAVITLKFSSYFPYYLQTHYYWCRSALQIRNRVDSQCMNDWILVEIRYSCRLFHKKCIQIDLYRSHLMTIRILKSSLYPWKSCDQEVSTRNWKNVNAINLVTKRCNIILTLPYNQWILNSSRVHFLIKWNEYWLAYQVKWVQQNTFWLRWHILFFLLFCYIVFCK